VRDAAALDAFFDPIEAKFGTIDILVNVAGGVKDNRFRDTTREQPCA
jgi:NAD(P)-dependent dehydrogenase (short-subunit alcohol dehydrogenase family)